jgi:hypothetical protein
MGFIGDTIILDFDVSMDKSCTMTYVQKKYDILGYLEHDQFEVIGPTTEICEHFKDEIGYCVPAPLLWVIRDNKLDSFRQNLNKRSFSSYDEVVGFLSDKTKRFYLSKVTKSVSSPSRSLWCVYVIEIDNLPLLRDQKLEDLGI